MQRSLPLVVLGAIALAGCDCGGMRGTRRVDAGRFPDVRVAPDVGPLPDDGGLDAAPPDSGPPDSGSPDSGPPDSGPPDSGGYRCMGEADPSIFISPCPAITRSCAPGMSCACSGACALPECTPSSCSGTASGAVRCEPGTVCSLDISGGGQTCAECAAYATCNFFGSFSGGQSITCQEGSDCTIDLSMASGGRIVDCTRAARCVVRLGGSGYSTVLCGPGVDCTVQNPSGIYETCCYMIDPLRCPDGSITCSGFCPGP